MFPWTIARCWLLALALDAINPRAEAARVAPAALPDIVLIIMDDLGYGDLGSYGVPDAKTPNIDRLAREGVKLTDFYTNGPNCSPTRAGFISVRWITLVSSRSPPCRVVGHAWD